MYFSQKAASRGLILFLIGVVCHLFKSPLVWAENSAKTSSSSSSWSFHGYYILDQHLLKVGDAEEKFLMLGSALIRGYYTYSENHFKVSLLGSHGGHSPSRDLGDIQIVSNIDTEGVEALRFYELFYARFFRDYEFSLGWKDLSTTINVTKPGLLFIHSSFGTTAEWGATGFRGPSIYPIPSFGFYFSSLQAWKDYYIKASITDPLHADHFYPKQMQSHIRLNLKNHMSVVEGGFEPGKNIQVALGAWNMEIEQGVLQPEFSQSGIYFQAHHLWGAHFMPFLRYGRAGEVLGALFENRVVGIEWLSLLPQLTSGLGYSYALVSGVNTPEEVYELTFKYSLLDWWQVQISQQQIVNPALGAEDGSLSTLRMIFTI